MKLRVCESFTDSETIDGSVITTWKDTNPQSLVKFNASSVVASNTSGPAYIARGLNDIPTLRFTNNGASAIRFLAVDSAFNNNKFGSMTMFVVLTYRSGSGYFIDRTTSSVPLFGAEVTSSAKLNIVARTDYNTFFNVGNYSVSSGSSYIVTLTRVYNQSFNIYVNGGGSSVGGATVTTTDSANNSLTLPTLKIGRHVSTAEVLDADISEIIFYDALVRSEDRDAIEEYLGKKYNIKVSNS